MSNQEKYKQAFSALHASDDFSLEVENMTVIRKKQLFKNIAAAIAVCLLLVGVGTTAYAADFGGIQRKIQLWVYGDKTDVTLEIHADGSYDMQYVDEEGNTHFSSGGGIVFEADGTERPLTEEEILDYLNEPEVSYYDDGTVWVYFYDQEIEITDMFEDGVCYVKVSGGGKTFYMTIKYQNGYSMSEDRYINPKEFN